MAKAIIHRTAIMGPFNAELSHARGLWLSPDALVLVRPKWVNEFDDFGLLKSLDHVLAANFEAEH